MSICVDHRFVLDLHGPDAVALGSAPAEIDWLPAVQCAHFQGIRDGRLPAVTVAPPARVEPMWHERTGPPRITGATIVMQAGDGPPVEMTVPLEYFGDAARVASASHVAAGRLEAGDTFTYRVHAYPVTITDAAPDDGLVVEPVSEPLVMTDGVLETLRDRGVPLGPGAADDLPVFVPDAVIEQTRRIAAEAGAVEAGGVLLGHLRRDGDELFVEITAQIPARDAPSTTTEITFTPRTWADARAALDLRGRGETIRGWWHSHPWWCRDCPDDRRARCPLDRIFFSAQDCGLHRTVFPRADQVALLISHRDDRFVPAVFGWRRGRIVSRGWHLLDPRDDADRHAVATPITIGGDERAPQ